MACGCYQIVLLCLFYLSVLNMSVDKYLYLSVVKDCYLSVDKYWYLPVDKYLYLHTVVQCPYLVRRKMEELISRPFLGEIQFQLLLDKDMGT